MSRRVVVGVQAIFLDFDGVVCDTERAARRSWEELYLASGTRLPEEVWNRMVGNADGAEVARADLAMRRGAEVRPEELAGRLARKRELAAREPLCAGVARLIGEAIRSGIQVAVVSSSPAIWVTGHLERLGVRNSLSFTVTGDETPRHKPAADLYLLALRRAGLSPTQALAVEDSLPGIKAAKAAGIRCAAVCADARLASALDADLVFPSLEHLTVNGGPAMPASIAWQRGEVLR